MSARHDDILRMLRDEDLDALAKRAYELKTSIWG